MLGNPSGASYKIWLDENMAIDAAIGINQSELDVHMDMLFHSWDFFRRIGFNLSEIEKSGALPAYIGIGPRLLFEDEEEFGIRIPLGVSFLPNNSVWEFFGEFAPVLRFTPSSGVDADFAIGARYYFPAIRPRSN